MPVFQLVWKVAGHGYRLLGKVASWIVFPIAVFWESQE